MDRSKSTRQQDDDDMDRKPAAQPTASVPEFRSVSIMAPGAGSTIPRPMSLAGASLKSAPEVIDKSSYFSAATKPDSKVERSSSASDIQSNWSPTQLRPVPAFYPLERSSRFVEEELSVVVSRVSEANRLLSVHAVYCDDTATASMLTAENVEMHLSLWKTSGKQEGIVIEIQRRKGDSIAFHRYSRCILDAAVGELDFEHVEQHGEDLDLVYSKKVHRLLSLEPSEDAGSETENAIIAVEIAHGLLMKDRMDARQLGLESLCLLTDPKKTGITTALIASRVVLLGTAQDGSSVAPEEGLMFDESPFQEIRQTILSLIQFRRIGDNDEFEEEEAESEDEEHITVLHNLALAVLANALDVIENEDLLAGSVPEDAPIRARAETSESISERFLEEAKEFSEDREILKTLISELGKANAKPHNACLSAKCIGSLCRASDKARRRAKDLGAKTVVQTALDVGTRTHLKLERECDKVMKTLNNTSTEE
mmetsp:Transcript_32908/g.55144  ORF Transcript_32908/g.55144 Transcript_32908/m.55144 type:complete len:483 (-) Transcript_32908:547-1995(-)|eukprot:CAMPEP_0178805416 /NCGR_PEP_ID=MMETSP0745-20121128/15707_1 /TAXON_ID=913974 /ORGANISM="Nitzschia punctata, Strain CCMP561" /LENGTH=482 /DNA_ID=CAMNT_0020464993 /DNA_START=194 /DNA_END=1642 /DNA_ORIENTATION=+